MTLLRKLAAALLLAATAAAHAQAHPVSGARVMELTKQYLAVAPHRAIGTPGHTAAEKFITSHFAPEASKGNFVTDRFSAHTPAGQMSMTNYIAKFPGKKDGIIVIASHYETNYPLQSIGFVGANDGACTTALLIALGDYYRLHPPQGYSIWLVFDDGEEAVGKEGMIPSDSLYGVRHLAAKWSGDGTIGKIKAFVVADMLGWKSMNIDREENSTPWLLDLLDKAAKTTGHSSSVFHNSMAIEDDHIPFKQRGVPVLDVIAYEYGPFEQQRGDYAFHHTAKDTIDKLSTTSLQTSADLFVELVKLIDQH
ncbi:MAG: M28 family peptidase [Acidobacteriaceae bacterium]|nr:M28 family peptidase [Acidobacteriaceae bacterium]